MTTKTIKADRQMELVEIWNDAKIVAITPHRGEAEVFFAYAENMVPTESDCEAGGRYGDAASVTILSMAEAMAVAVAVANGTYREAKRVGNLPAHGGDDIAVKTWRIVHNLAETQFAEGAASVGL